MRAGSNWRHLNGLSLGMMGDPVRCLPKVVHPDVAALKLQHNLLGSDRCLDGQPERPAGWAAALLGSRHRDRSDPAAHLPSPAAPGRRVPARAVRDNASRPLRSRLYDALPAQSAFEAPSAIAGPARREPPSRARQHGAVPRRGRGVGGRVTRWPRPAWLAEAPPWRRSVRRDPCPHADRGDE